MDAVNNTYCYCATLVDKMSDVMDVTGVDLELSVEIARSVVSLYATLVPQGRLATVIYECQDAGIMDTVITHKELMDGRLFRITETPDAPSVARWFYDFEDIPHQIYLVVAALRRLDKMSSKWSGVQ